MKSGSLVTAAGAFAVTSVAAVSFPRAVQGDGYLRIPVNHVEPDLSSLTKREAFKVALANRDFYYSMDFQIGTPGQKVTVLLDTGSSELWVNPDCTTAPSSSQARQCSNSGQYDPRNSRTPPTGPFGNRKLNYGDPSDPATQTSAEIAYYSDTITMGAGVVLNQTFGVVTKSDGISSGILGLAPDLRTGFDNGKPYSLILNSLSDQGTIKSRAFTLDLRHSGSDNGALIFGGVDQGKYIGKLERLPIVPGSRGDPRLAVDLASIGMALANNKPKAYTLAAEDKNVMLDSGTTLTRLHPALARPILADLKAVADGDGYWVTDCVVRTPPLTNGGGDSFVTFGFGKKTLRVPLSDFVLDLGPRAGQCYVGLVITSDQQILGDSVLRAGYFVFDWDNKAIHVAQAANCGKEQIVAIGKGPDAVPSSAVGLCQSESGDSDNGDSTTTAVSQKSASVVNPATTNNFAEPETNTFSLSTSASSKATASAPASAPAPASASASASPSARESTLIPLTPSSPQATTSPPDAGNHDSPASTSGPGSSAAFSWKSESRHLGLLLGTLMTLAAALWNV